MVANAMQWTMGHAYVSNTVYRYLSRTRERIMRRDEKKAAEKAAKAAAETLIRWPAVGDEQKTPSLW